MLEILLFVAITVIGVQAIIIANLVKLVEKTRKERSKQGKELRGVIKALIESTSNLQIDLEDYKDAYNDCHKEFSILFRENKLLKNKLSYIEDLHSHMVNNLHVLLKEGRIIKNKDKVIPYNCFGELSGEERLELFGA